jgi:hypothetical protein
MAADEKAPKPPERAQEKVTVAKDKGTAVGIMLANVRASLVSEGVDERKADELTKSVVSAMSSIMDGHCEEI